MTTLIVNASSKSKREFGAVTDYSFGNRTFLESLDDTFQVQMKKSREQLSTTLNIPKGSDLGIYKVKSEPEEYLPAYVRYSGMTYSKISMDAWNSLKKSKDMDMVILSALYGLIRYDEPVRNYHIKQADKMGTSKIGNFWKKEGASDWLKSYILNNNYDQVKFVLSTSYSDIVKRDKLIEELNKDHGIEAVDKQHKGAGRASMLERGKYIDSLLLGNL